MQNDSSRSSSKCIKSLRLLLSSRSGEKFFSIQHCGPWPPLSHAPSCSLSLADPAAEERPSLYCGELSSLMISISLLPFLPAFNRTHCFKLVKFYELKWLSMSWLQLNPEDPCIICHDDMNPGQICVLQCRHSFHDWVSHMPFFFFFKKTNNFALIIWTWMMVYVSLSWIWGFFVFSASVSGWKRTTRVPTVELKRYCLISLFWPVGDAKRLEVFAKLDVITVLFFF